MRQRTKLRMIAKAIPAKNKNFIWVLRCSSKLEGMDILLSIPKKKSNINYLGFIWNSSVQITPGLDDYRVHNYTPGLSSLGSAHKPWLVKFGTNAHMETPTLKKMSAKLTNMSDFCLCLFWTKGSFRPMKLQLNLKNLPGWGVYGGIKETFMVSCE